MPTCQVEEHDYIVPSAIIAENVAGHVDLGLDTALVDLETAGYTAWPFIIPVCAVGAPHRRDRVWIIAHASTVPGDNAHCLLAEIGFEACAACLLRLDEMNRRGVQGCKDTRAEIIGWFREAEKQAGWVAKCSLLDLNQQPSD